MKVHRTAHRRRIASGLMAPGVLGMAVLLAAPWSNPGSPTTTATAMTAAASPCYDMVSIAVGGRNDAPREGTHEMLVAPDGTRLPASLSTEYGSHWVDPVVNAPRQAVGGDSYAAVYIDYPANMASYEDAVNAGMDNTETVMRTISAACPNTKFAVVGYSEGADVARRVAMEIGNQETGQDGSYEIIDPASVVGVVILADAGRGAGEGPFPGAEDESRNPDGFDLAYQTHNASAPGSGALPGTSGGFGALDGKVASFCSDGDLTCSAPENIALLQLAVNVGRQLNVDLLEREGLTPATGQDVAMVLGRIALTAFADISAQQNWMQSDETFLDVLVKVSDPAYEPATTSSVSDTSTQPIPLNEAAGLVYLPSKLRNEIIGFIADNENTIQVAMSDPYQQTLGEGTGHHFDYWRDADAANGKPLTSAEYAAAWLTHLAKEADAGNLKTTTTDPSAKARAVSSLQSADNTTVRSSTTDPKSLLISDSSTAEPAPPTTAASVTTAVSAAKPAAVIPSPSPAPAATSAAATPTPASTTAEASAPPTSTPVPTTQVTTAQTTTTQTTTTQTTTTTTPAPRP
ncbi:MAG: cutinase family protein [Rhodococcus sp. (in: high G+C Gram-positive bacteria)]|uniref:cutinase family protein n=1 Tax=Rhodococcus sp. TaxID=1831 RepID=UPI003BB12C75